MDYETSEALKLPAALVNRFQVFSSPTTVRVAFGETLKGDTTCTKFRAAVVMTSEDAKQLAELITRLTAPKDAVK